MEKVITGSHRTGDMKIFPNPSDGDFTITVENGNLSYLKLVNMSGSVIWHSELKNHSVSLSPQVDLKHGIYFIQFYDSSDSFVGVKRLIIVD